ncbi:MAG TPA: Flp family type IVb pilin [Candidatus Eisenbacteria bacterium]|nr:Flp family type IVb pilin [Candidatus Eisenbacteria bacterium]
MIKLTQRFISDEKGEDLIEYGLLSSFVAAVALATIISDPVGIRSALVDAFGKATEALYMAAQTDLVR